MAFYNEITQYNTLTTTHCDNFNEVNQKILENTLQNHQDIGNLNLLSTTQKDSLVSAVNEVKQSIPSSTNINQTIDQKISTHNQLTTSHQDIRSQVKTLENQIQGINISANIETHNTNQTAHQDIRSEINVLSKRNYYTLADFERTEKFNTIDDCVTAMGSYGSAYLDTNLCFTDMSIFPSANGVLIVEKSNLNRTVLTYLTSVVNPEDSKIFMSFYRSVSTPSYSWKPVSTTDKTDILQSDLLNGWVIALTSYENSLVKVGNQVFVKLMVKNEAPNQDSIITLPFSASKATHLFVTTQNRKNIQCRVVNNSIFLPNYQELGANEWVCINGSYNTNS